MANSKQAKKRARQAEKHRKHNAARRTEMRTYIKNVAKALEAKDIDKAKAQYIKASSMLDKLACKGIIAQNTASRHKSRLNTKIKQAAAA